MGVDKAGLPFRGVTLAKYVAREVEIAVGSATLLGNPAIGIADLYPREGPLGGIVTALTHTTAEWNLIVACDMPGIQAPFLRRLVQAAAESDADALLPRGPSGLVEPLCAVYRRGALAPIRAKFNAGTRKITTALEDLAVVALDVTEVAQFQNVNTPEDWTVHAGK